MDREVTTPAFSEVPTAETPVIHPDDTLVVPAVPTPETPVVHPDDTLVVPAVPTPDDTAAVPAVEADDTQQTMRVNAPPRDDTPSSYNVLVEPQDYGERTPSPAGREDANEARNRKRNRRRVFGALAFMVALVVVIVAVVLDGGSGGKGHPGARAAAAPVLAAQAVTGVKSPTAAPTVQAAAQRSVAKKAVVVTVGLASPNSDTPTSQVSSGTGAFVLANGLGSLTVSWPGATPATQKFAFLGAFLYVNVPNSPIPGKTWVVTSTNSPPALGPNGKIGELIVTMGNPGLLLNQLASTPLSVTALGSSSVGDIAVESYEVHLGSNPTVSSAAGFGTHISEEVDVDAHRLVRRIVIPGPQIVLNGQTVQENIVVVFSHYGKPTVLTTPPSSQVMTYSQYAVRPAATISGLPANSGGS